MSKSYAITLNNPTQDELSGFRDRSVAYSIYQIEIGERGTEHAQGFLHLIRRERVSHVKRIFPRAHIEITRGTISDNIDYCSKEETRVRGPFEYGRRPVSEVGARNDILAFREAIKEGKSDSELLDDFPHMIIKYQKFIYFVRSATLQPRNSKPSTVVHWGPSGTGKTRTAVGEDTDVFIVSRPDNGRPLWWDGYTGQQRCILDDFYGWIPWSYLLQLLDRYPFQVEIKGGKVHFNSPKIFITSNTEPHTWYKNIPNNDMTPLLRRIDEIIKFN